MTVAGQHAAGPSNPSLSRSSEGQRAGSPAPRERRDQRASLPRTLETKARTPRRDDRPHDTTGTLPAAFVDELTRALRQQRAFREDQLARLEAAGESPSDRVRREVDATLRSAARLVLAEIDAALRRIELGRFGRCDRCGNVMSSEQLRALPMSTWCGSCQRLRELTVIKRLPGPSDRRPASGPASEPASGPAW